MYVFSCKILQQSGSIYLNTCTYKYICMYIIIYIFIIYIYINACGYWKTSKVFQRHSSLCLEEFLANMHHVWIMVGLYACTQDSADLGPQMQIMHILMILQTMFFHPQTKSKNTQTHGERSYLKIPESVHHWINQWSKWLNHSFNNSWFSIERYQTLLDQFLSGISTPDPNKFGAIDSVWERMPFENSWQKSPYWWFTHDSPLLGGSSQLVSPLSRVVGPLPNGLNGIYNIWSHQPLTNWDDPK